MERARLKVLQQDKIQNKETREKAKDRRPLREKGRLGAITSETSLFRYGRTLSRRIDVVSEHSSYSVPSPQVAGGGAGAGVRARGDGERAIWAAPKSGVQGPP
ncbi:hypothetical protein EVAR_6042_1 [Eumeta japonica]|uniref:Uncharacterized protein n=1 Tax=Eumeta variegata TaxID=151549 RepID=A0A4C1TCU7_EUMVA|nr:hypothetical protein EVAR_6042_1 [Eumeta japonica]